LPSPLVNNSSDGSISQSASDLHQVQAAQPLKGSQPPTPTKVKGGQPGSWVEFRDHSNGPIPNYSKVVLSKIPFDFMVIHI